MASERDRAVFTENDVGVHVMNERNGEFTLCGDAWDAPMSEADWADGDFRPTKKRTVTCPNCAAIIVSLRGIRVARTSNGG